MAATLTVSAAATNVATTAFSTSLRLSLSNFSLPLRRTLSLSSHQFNITFAPTKPDPISKPDLIIKPDSITKPELSTRLGDQMFIPWIIRGEDGKLTLQSGPPERLLREMAVSETKAVKTKREKVKAEARLVKREKVKEPEFSKAARRFYNENFREKPQRICKVLAAAGGVLGEDGKLTLQSGPPERLLREMAVSETKAVKTKREKVKAEARLVKREKVKEPEFSKAARRFYNENFREKPQRICKVLAAAGVRGEDGKLTLQSGPPERLLREMTVSETKAVKTKREKVKEPEFSKAARRFYNENFREKPQRICKVLAAAGVASRRSSEELVSKGLVTVNGSVCTTPQTKVDPAKDVIYVKGNRLPKKLPPKVYFALNKPKGYICSSGEKETKSVVSLFDDYMKTWDKRNPGQPKPRLFTVGRLDVATTGLIIVTNDGEFAQKLSHPSSNLSKEYIATIDGTVNKRHLITISEGTVIDGTHCTPDVVELLPQQPDIKRHRLRIVVHEGRNHEVRELVKNAGLQMYLLKRVRIGGYRLPTDLLLGKHVELKQSNLSTLGWKNVKAQKPKPE